jgi:alpha-galactosidase
MNIQKGTIKYIYRKREYTLNFRVGGIARMTGMEVSSELIHLDHGWRIIVKLEPEEAVTITSATFDANYRFTRDDMIFCNGFQSWTESRKFAPGEKMKKLARSARRFKVHCFGDYHFYPYSGDKGKLHSYVYCYIKQKTGDYTLLGSLLEDTGYTIYALETRKNRISVIKDVEGLVVSEPYVLIDLLQLQGPKKEVLAGYFNTICPDLQTREPATGWTSWYKHYTDITEEIILGNLETMSKNRVPLEYFQIDDGYQTAVGDWLSIKPTFPNGMKHIADSIRSKHYTPGLWLAPFICEERSSIFRDHPDWLLRKNGEPVPAGWNPLWSGTFYALDIYNDEFRYHIKEVFDTVLNQWGFDMVKLDFLYAAAMTPREGKTRGTIMMDAMRFLRRCVGEKTLLGCGVPLGTAFGLVDYCRIGSDVAPKWEDRILAAIHYRERVSTVNSLRSTSGRSHLNGRVFVNDPDVVILRDEDNALTTAERHTLCMVNNIFGGLMFISDDISLYSDETMRMFRSMFPFAKKEIDRVDEYGPIQKVMFRIGTRDYVAFINITARKGKAVLDEGLFFCNTLDEERRFTPGGTEVVLKPHESRCYLVVSDDFFTVAGTTGHIFPGAEIVSCIQKGDIINVAQYGQAKNANTVYIRTPALGQYLANGRTMQARKIREKLFVLAIEL